VSDREPVQIAAASAGAAFVLVGIAGFVPGVTTHLGSLSFAGHASQVRLLGVFQVSVLHNLLHLAFGCGILLARTPAGARTFLLGGGFVYLSLWLVGVIGRLDGLPANAADNWLHLVLGLALFGLLALTSRENLGDDLERDLGRGLAT
jgi:hypothetical protein